jgi:predicted nucleic acid-binding protein
LLDDKEARKEAIDLDLKVIGTAGLLLSAKRKGLISSVMVEIRKLEERINFRLSEDLKQYIKEQAGE